MGEGVVEIIAAGDAIRQNDVTSITAPTLDFTVGLVEDFDATLVVSPVFDIDSRGGDDTSEFVEAGIKWQLLRSTTWNASVSPAMGSGSTGESRFGATFPVQVEYSFGSIAVGSDAAYTVVANGADGWRAGEYLAAVVAPRLTLALEVWAVGTRAPNTSDLGIGAGFDWEAASHLHLLMAGGTGLTSNGNDRADWYLYAGVQWVTCVGKLFGDRC